MSGKTNGRPRKAFTPQNIDNVRTSILQSSRRSTRRCTYTLGKPLTFQRILRRELKLQQYKIMIMQKLYERDFEHRRRFCERILDILSSVMMLCS